MLVPGGFTDYNFYRARKEIIHSFRYLLFAIQLVKTGHIFDYGAANSYLTDIMQEQESEKDAYLNGQVSSVGGRKRGAKRGNSEWNAIIARFRPIFEKLKQELKDLQDYAHLYSRHETEKMFFISLKERIKRDGLRLAVVTYDFASPEPREEQIVSEHPLMTIRFLQNYKGTHARLCYISNLDMPLTLL